MLKLRGGLLKEGGEVGADGLSVRVIRAKGGFEDSQGLLVVGTGSGVVAHGFQQGAQVVQAEGGVGVLLAQDFALMARACS